MRNQTSHRGWTIAKLVFGSIYILLIIIGIVLLNRMAAFRSTLEYPESGLFIARALILMPMGACLVMAIWGFISAKIHIKRDKLRTILIVIAVVLGIACIAFCIWGYCLAYSYYAPQANWPLLKE